jgi:S-adenosylmethionine-diacylglycerol 3-amino-3-carboxypropyl transferase
MTSKALIDSAVINSTTAGSKGLADRLFAHWFSRLVYAQIWEDPQSDIDALQLEPGSRILTISSGGCNALAYLSTRPSVVHAVDLNAAHLAMLNIKQQAIRHLPDYQSVLSFLGDAGQEDNLKRYQRHIREHLDSNARAFWEKRSLNGKPRYHYFTRQTYQHGLLGEFIGLSHWLARRLGGDLSKMMEARDLQDQARLFDQYVAPVFDTAFSAGLHVSLWPCTASVFRHRSLKNYAKMHRRSAFAVP